MENTEDQNGQAGSIVEGPLAQALRAELASVRERALEVLCETDDIRMQQNPQIEADYAAKIGFWENRLLEADVAARRAKRRLELARAFKNRGEDVDGRLVENQLDDEFAAWNAQLAVAVERFRALMEDRLNSKLLSGEDAAELKRLYRRAAKRLHPDVDPHPSPEHTQLFALVQKAYANGDLPALRALCAMVDDLQADTGEPTSTPAARVEEELAAAIEVETATLRVFEERLAELKAAFPYCFALKLENPAWVHERTTELYEAIDAANDLQNDYDKRYQDLCGEDPFRHAEARQ